MKINSSLSKYIYGNLMHYILKNNSKVNKNSNSPIKVRKKNNILMKDNSLESFKSYKLTNLPTKKKLNKKSKQIDFNIYIRKNLIKHNSHPLYFYIKIANQLLFNFPNHLVSLFKDLLIWNEKYDYFKNIYPLDKSNELIPKLGNYYQTYTLFIPVYFPLKDINCILSKYIKNKIKILEMTENDNDNNYEEIKVMEMEKNINENNINNINGGNIKKIKENNENKKKGNIASYEDNKKLINTADIKSENSVSVSNFFGVDSVIKFKENSNYGVINNFEKQIINYSLLSKIKEEHRNKKNEDKVNLDFSSELASIIQSFEEKEKNYIKKKNRTPKNSPNKKSEKDFSKNGVIPKEDNYKTNINFYIKKQNPNIKSNKNISSEYQINNLHSKIKTNVNMNLSPKKINKNIILLNYNENKQKLLSKKAIKNKISDFYNNLHLTLNSESYNPKNKGKNDIICTEDEKYGHKFSNTETNLNNLYNSYKINKKPKNKKCIFLYKKQFITKEKEKENENEKMLNNNERNKSNCKNIITKSKESITYKIIKNDKNDKNNKNNKNNNNIDKRKYSKRRINHRNNITLNFGSKTNYYEKKEKEKEYFKINSSSSLKQRTNNFTRNKKNNADRSQSQKYCLKKNFSNWKKMIYVNKKTENNNSKSDKKNINKANSFKSFYKDFKALNYNKSNKTLNKIIVHKKDNLTKRLKSEKKLNAAKTKSYLDIMEIYNNSIKKSLNHYKSFVESDYNAFIPKTIIKKMFFNKIKNEKIKKNINNKNSSLKKHNISSKNNQNTYSSINSNNTKIKDYHNKYNKLIEIKIPRTSPNKNEINKNHRTLTEYNNLIISPKTETHSPVKTEYQRENKNISKGLSLLPINNKTNNNKTNSFKKNNSIGKFINIKFNKTLQDTHKLKTNNNLKKSFANKNSLMINVNIFNDFKINQENKGSKFEFKKKELLNDSIKSTYINKNKIHYLIKNSESFINNTYQKKSHQLLNPKPNTIKINNYSIYSTALKKRATIKNFKLKTIKNIKNNLSNK